MLLGQQGYTKFPRFLCEMYSRSRDCNRFMLSIVSYHFQIIGRVLTLIEMQ